jgi:hypothetical protein
VAIITYPDRICSSMASSTISSFLSTGMYKDHSAAVFLYDENKLDEIVKEIIKYNPDILFIAYGGEQRLSYVADITKRTIEELMKNNYRKALAIHVRIWLATKQLSNIISDNKLKIIYCGCTK